jgi:UPF0716 protein FxsA
VMRLVSMFAIVALAELGIFLAVERQIGIFSALLIALFTAVLGSALVKRAGISVWSRIQDKLASGSLPGRELSAGASILVSGALLISPGFLTDVIGFLLLVPAVQNVVHNQIIKRFGDKINIASRFGDSGFPGSNTEVIDVDAWEV